MKKLRTEVTSSDNSEARRCPDCLNWFRVLDSFPDSGRFVTECPTCQNVLVYTEADRV